MSLKQKLPYRTVPFGFQEEPLVAVLLNYGQPVARVAPAWACDPDAVSVGQTRTYAAGGSDRESAVFVVDCAYAYEAAPASFCLFQG